MVDNISGVNPLGNSQKSGRLRKVYGQPAQQAKASDSVQVSSEIKELSKMEGIRLEKVMEMKKAIADGNYLTDEKLDVSLDRAIDEAFGGDKK